MEQINKLGSVVYYTRKLVNIDINSIREIPSLSDFREVITESLTHLYRFYGEEDFIHLIDEIYQYEEEQHNKNKEFYNSLTLKEDKHYRDELEEILKVHKSFSRFVEDDLYSVCCQYNAIDYPNYSLMDYFMPILEKLRIEGDFPAAFANDIDFKLKSKEEDAAQQLRNIKDLSSYSWYQKRIEDFKKYEWFSDHKKKNLYTFLDNIKNPKPKEECDIYALFNQSRDSKETKEEEAEDIQANIFKDRQSNLLKLLKQYSISKEERFSLLNYYGLNSILNAKIPCYKNRESEIKIITEDISEHISNENLLQIMKFFPELGLSAEATDKAPYYKRSGKPRQYYNRQGVLITDKSEFGDIIFKDITLVVSPKVKWMDEHKDAFEELLTHFNLIDRLSYDSGLPIIKL
ncbi:MAG: hypothetical protein CL760_12055 [Chloroflexi bacterium]|nr:hypothetical protein [Chloroflexota bacterium]|tara:strand:+ start:20135 stop:21346 length:1212 start_codon:yes stop_codon:yes gene_type:complete